MNVKEIGNSVKIFLQWIFTSIILLTALTIVHELGHCAAAILTDGECFGICFLINAEADNFWEKILMGTYAIPGSDESFFIILIAGSCFASFVSTCLMVYAYFKKNECLFEISKVYIFCEFAYWLMSPFILLGDGYDLIQYFNINKNSYYFWLIFSLIIFIVFSRIFSRKFIKRLGYIKI